jgi:hypothetical protein
MNITVKHIEELVSIHEKKFRVEEVDGKFIITIIRDYENRKIIYELHKVLNQRLEPVKKLTEKLNNFIPTSLFIIKKEEINIPLYVIETDFNTPTYRILNNSTYGMGINSLIDPYTTYVDINNIP